MALASLLLPSNILMTQAKCTSPRSRLMSTVVIDLEFHRTARCTRTGSYIIILKVQTLNLAVYFSVNACLIWKLLSFFCKKSFFPVLKDRILPKRGFYRLLNVVLVGFMIMMEGVRTSVLFFFYFLCICRERSLLFLEGEWDRKKYEMSVFNFHYNGGLEDVRTS
jgi:hypothetical protein